VNINKKGEFNIFKIFYTFLY